MENQKDRVREQFGRNAESYVNSQDHSQGESLKRLVELVQPHPEWRVLDISTGGGHTAIALAPLVSHVVATDLTPLMVSAAREHVLGLGVQNITFRVADSESLPFQENEFDLVTSRLGLHHYGDASKGISEMARVCRPGGRVVLIDNIVSPDPDVSRFVNSFELLHDPSHQNCYSPAELERMIENAGLVVEHSELIRKDRDLEAWADRSGCTPETKARLVDMLRNTPEGSRAFLNPRLSGERWAFSLTEAVILAMKVSV